MCSSSALLNIDRVIGIRYSTGMAEYRIEGGKTLSGEIVASGNKNAALPVLAATLLTDEPVVLNNIPEIEDVRVMVKILKALGSTVIKSGDHQYTIKTMDIASEIPGDLAGILRGSILFAAPILARLGKVRLTPPGGDIIGKRRLDTHFVAFETLGAKCKIDENNMLNFTAPSLKGDIIFLDEASVTATENAIMAAVLAKGTTTIRNAASEPHVQDLCHMLIDMGANISGVGSNLLVIEGVKKLHSTEFTIGSDFMEVGSYIGLTAVTGGDVVIHNVRVDDLRTFSSGYRKLGITWEEEGSIIRIPPKQLLKVQPDIGGMIPKISDGPWPGFPTDLTSIITVVATQVNGVVLIHEKMYESRMFFTDDLVSMGANIVLCDPHRAIIYGPAKLKARVLNSPDVRAGMAQVIAALCARGESVIQNIYQIERGYENIYSKLQILGARISRTETNTL